jgi:hypothetical protein
MNLHLQCSNFKPAYLVLCTSADSCRPLVRSVLPCPIPDLTPDPKHIALPLFGCCSLAAVAQQQADCAPALPAATWLPYPAVVGAAVAVCSVNPQLSHPRAQNTAHLTPPSMWTSP